MSEDIHLPPDGTFTEKDLPDALRLPLPALHLFESDPSRPESHRILVLQIIADRYEVRFKNWAEAEETWRKLHRLTRVERNRVLTEMEAFKYDDGGQMLAAIESRLDK